MHVLHDFLSKSILGFEKWTKKMSKIEKSKYFCAKSHASHTFLFFWLTENIIIILLLY